MRASVRPAGRTHATLYQVLRSEASETPREPTARGAIVAGAQTAYRSQEATHASAWGLAPAGSAYGSRTSKFARGRTAPGGLHAGRGHKEDVKR